MKMTEFEVGEKYEPIDFKIHGWVILSGDGFYYDSFGCQVYATKVYLLADWQEYKEPVDYGTFENHKLILIDGSWIEGYAHSEDSNLVVMTIGRCRETTSKSRVLKVIDLPSKEL